MLLSRTDLLKPAPRRYEEFQLSDGHQCRIRSLTEGERSQWEMSNVDAKGTPKRDRMLSARRRLICLTLVDADNRPLFTLEDEASLAEQDGRLMEEIYKAAAKHCGISESDVEALAKNSPETPADVLP